MQIVYKNKRLEKVCTNAAVATKKYGIEMAGLIQRRIDEMKAIDSIETMIKFRLGRCHPLKGNRKEQFAVDLVHPFRMVFEKVNEEIYIVRIIEKVDYHD